MKYIKIVGLLSLFIIALSFAYYFFIFIPRRQSIQDCVNTYPSDWVISIQQKIHISPQELCQSGYSFSIFTEHLKETILKLKNENPKEDIDTIKNKSFDEVRLEIMK